MSAQDEQETPGETPPKAGKPTAKKPATKKPAKASVKEDATSTQGGPDAKKPAAGKASTVETKPDAAEPATEAKPAAKKPAAAKKPSEVKEPTKSEGKASKKPATEKKAARIAAAKPPRRRVVRAHARYVRTSARKARMVCGHLRGKSVGEARAILAFTPREVARDWSKLLESAVANAENNHELLEDDLVVREAYADEGPTIKRFRPRAMGRATPIHKRTSHLTITLTPGS